ncbi:MAG: hypothetical protein GF344_04705 [Chitinivibrionales bacterium]|nr:hypothetical protein [Chitinivibrionales bacterium]
MNNPIADTSPAMAAQQHRLLRNAGFVRRFYMCVSLSRFAMKRSRENFLLSHQGMSRDEWRRAYIKALYGRAVYNDLFGSKGSEE